MSLEDDRIRWIERRVGVAPRDRFPVHLGDDAAVMRPTPGHDIVLTVDAQVEGTHFERAWMAAADVGWRAVASSVSDLAAMAARPRALLASVLVPKGLAEREFRALYDGIARAAEHWDLVVAGGNLSRGPLSVHITAIGEVRRGRHAPRGRLRHGDDVIVTGCPGLARAGYEALRGHAGMARTSPDVLDAARRAFRRPEARVRVARAVAEAVSSFGLIDSSDGLAADLARAVALASRTSGEAVDVVVESRELGVLSPLAACAAALGVSPAHLALAGGEDYELCVFAPPEAREAVVRAATGAGVPARRVGRVERGAGRVLLEDDEGRREEVEDAGYAHF